MLTAELLPTSKDVVNIKNVAIYGRVSTTEQAEEGYSIDEQVRLSMNGVKTKVTKYMKNIPIGELVANPLRIVQHYRNF